MDRTGVKEGESTVLLLAIDDNLFKTCFGADPLWPCKLECLSEKCTESELTTSLKSSYCVVVDDEEECPHWETVKQYYRDGGLVVWFGIHEEFSTPAFLSREFGLEWKFSAYTAHEYVLTSVGKRPGRCAFGAAIHQIKPPRRPRTGQNHDSKRSILGGFCRGG
jgi:hypothetical protein